MQEGEFLLHEFALSIIVPFSHRPFFKALTNGSKVYKCDARLLTAFYSYKS